MKVAILSSGRFHVLDLARELVANGHEVLFYSLVPPWQTRRFGLPMKANRWLGPALGPLWLAYRGLSRAGRTDLARTAHRIQTEGLDRAVAALLEPCDVLITMSGMGLHTLRKAKRRGAFTLVERGSMHIEAQRQILASNPEAGRDAGGPIPDWVIARELAEYAECDLVSVPSHHAEASFHERGVTHTFRNPYGVSLSEFTPTRAPTHRRILMVGTWSFQKGVDTLVEAFARLRARPGFSDLELHHVGPVGDLALPTVPGFTHHAPVPQAELTRFYAEATVSVLPSRQDGFGMVLCQSLAAGVPIVASTRTGGPDLAGLVSDPRAVSLVAPEDVAALADALAEAVLGRAAPGSLRSLLSEAERDSLSWRGYGRRYDQCLRERVVDRGGLARW